MMSVFFLFCSVACENMGSVSKTSLPGLGVVTPWKVGPAQTNRLKIQAHVTPF